MDTHINTSSPSNKAYILQSIYSAKRAHKEWVKRADKLVNGYSGYQGKQVDLKIDKSYIPLHSDSCEFGQWFDKEAVKLAKFEIVGNFIERIEEHHEALHKTYAHIYNIFFLAPPKRSILQKFIQPNRKKISNVEREKAQIHFDYLKKSSSELIAVLEVLEDKIKALHYTDLEH